MRILVTRPQPGAAETAERLKARGHVPILLPLSRIAPAEVSPHAAAARFDAVVASSVNSIRHAPRWLLDQLAGKVFHVVGEATAAAVREAGLQVGEIADGAEDLARCLIGNIAPGTRLAYLCGRVRLPVFQARMDAAGLIADPIEVYDTLPVSCSDDAVLRHLGEEGVDAVMLYSSLAAESFRDLAARPVLAPHLGRLKAFCFSGRIAKALGSAFSGERLVARRPVESAMLALLDENS